nr:hypothetical protein [Bradyrhizobium sp. Gha]
MPDVYGKCYVGEPRIRDAGLSTEGILGRARRSTKAPGRQAWSGRARSWCQDHRVRLRHIGFDVIAGPLFQTPQEAASLAVGSKVHVVGISSPAAGHNTLVPQVIEALRAQGAMDIPIVAWRRRAASGLSVSVRLWSGSRFRPRDKRAGRRSFGARPSVRSETKPVSRQSAVTLQAVGARS